MNFQDINLLNRPIAHRGLHDGNKYIPENTLIAFNRALEENYPVELDVQIIKDKTVIVFHDANLIRSCNQKVKIKSLVYQDLRDITVFNTSQRISTLTEVLELIDGKIPVIIDIKNYSINKRLEEALLDILKDYKGEIGLQSFNPFTVRWLKKYTKYYTGYLVSKYNYLYFFDHFLIKNKNVIDFIAIDKNLLNTIYFIHLSQKNIPLLLWTFSNAQEKCDLENYCDNYMFECFIPA